MAAEAAHKMVTGAADETVPCTHPWFAQRRVEQSAALHELFSTWSPDTDWLLHDHRTANGDAPRAGCRLPRDRAGCARRDRCRPGRSSSASSVFFRPLAIADGTSREVRTRLVPIDNGYSFELSERARDRPPRTPRGPGGTRRGWRRTANCDRSCCSACPRRARSDIDAIEARCATRGSAGTASRRSTCASARAGRWSASPVSVSARPSPACTCPTSSTPTSAPSVSIRHSSTSAPASSDGSDRGVHGRSPVGDRSTTRADRGVLGHLPADGRRPLCALTVTRRRRAGSARFDVTLADLDGRGVGGGS